MPKLTRAALIKPKTKEVTVDGGTVTIRKLTADEAFDLRGKEIQKAEIYGIISMSLVDPEMSVEDIGLIATTMVTELTNEIFTFNALGPKAIAEAQSELKKTTTEEQPTELPTS